MSGSCPVSAHVCRETARERDELRAEVERLRERLAQVEAEYDSNVAAGRLHAMNMTLLQEHPRERHCRLCEAAHAPLDPTKETTDE